MPESTPPQKQDQTIISRNAEKFLVRLPDGMRERIGELSKKMFISTNSAIVIGLASYLDNHEELQILIEGNRLLRQSLIEQQKLLSLERAEISALKAQLDDTLDTGRAK